MNSVILFKGTVNESNYDLMTDLVLVDVDEDNDDLLLTLDLCGITLEYISTNKGLELDSAYLVDGGYCYLPLKEFDLPKVKNCVSTLLYFHLKGDNK